MFRCRFIPLTQEPHFPYNFDHNDEDLDQEAIRNCLSEQRVVLANPILIPFPYVLVRCFRSFVIACFLSLTLQF